MTDRELPPITEIQRFRPEPGDSLAVHVPDHVHLSMADAQRLRDRVRAGLGLPGDFPVLVLGDGMSLEVVARP